MLLGVGTVVCPAVAPAFAGDSIRGDQWHLDSMHAPELWNTSKGENITVAVIDGGFKLDHPDLAGQFLPGKDFSGGSGGVGSYVEGHGTGISSLIAGTGRANGGKGAYGLAPGAKILPLKIDTGAGGSVPDHDFLDQIGQAVTYAVEHGAKVINISLGTRAAPVDAADVANLNKILAWARAKGSLVVASVGNDAQVGNPVEYPGALPNVVGVGATDREGKATDESESGPQVTLVAPGMDMIAACTGSTGYCKSHGTSDSAALVSASAALVWSVHPEWTANQILRVLINTAGKPSGGSDRTDYLGYGAVRPRIALVTPGDPGPADKSPLSADSAPPTAVPSPTVSASATPSSRPSPTETDVAVGAPPSQPKADASSGSGGSVLPIVGGVVAGLVVVAGVVFVVVRRRKGAVYPPNP
ncbi:S8 family serine peptidase [Kitasatospora sp. NPDC051170]|uniref:S8 family serine peptidase n=1 Tax=Kitasatospora sp. NPDC051170 TaxID=3364056 RepID=UPI003793F17C